MRMFDFHVVRLIGVEISCAVSRKMQPGLPIVQILRCSICNINHIQNSGLWPVKLSSMSSPGWRKSQSCGGRGEVERGRANEELPDSLSYIKLSGDGARKREKELRSERKERQSREGEKKYSVAE
ncbi:hypothetical protein FQA47_008327 [Oryzias melastigma]|uniref:Uncharacterized protein n=1 Tax=Oryzias melastigma TaxID=30732 RepID=A0A834CF12_ORYME|nr:hypothetical protein FQA47_008327 [Oryzias melastigma]